MPKRIRPGREPSVTNMRLGTSGPGIYVAAVPPVPTVSSATTASTAFLCNLAEGPACSTHGSMLSFQQAYYPEGESDDVPFQMVRSYFLNGGDVAIIVRVPDNNLSGYLVALQMAKDAGANLVCIPSPAPASDTSAMTWQAAAAFCRQHGMFLLVDPPSHWQTAADVSGSSQGLAMLGLGQTSHAAVYFPPLLNGDSRIPPAGAIAGLMCKNDQERGVWKSPAGTTANLVGLSGLAAVLDQQDQAALNGHNVNSLVNLAGIGYVVWGARTLERGEYRYIAVKRLALYIKNSVSQSLAWTRGRANDAHLWTQVTSMVTTFMQSLFRQGAFQGSRADQAYFVHCGLGRTMTAQDVTSGQLRLQIGFAPLKPAEFIVLDLQQSLL